MVFSVPFNGDLRLLEALGPVEVVDENTVTNVYGCATTRRFGSGRSKLAMEVDEDALKEAIAICHRDGREFDYTLNAPFLGGREDTDEGVRQLRSELEWIMGTGANRVIVASTFLLKLSKQMDPSYPVSVSRVLATNDPEQLRQAMDVGADRVCLGLSVIRQLNALEHMAQMYGDKVQILANDACAYGCMRQIEHSHRSGVASGEEGSGYYMPDCTMWCALEALKDPVRFIKSNFIRPEDLGAYRDIGIEHFKLTDRNKPTEWILNVLGAYQQGAYRGNLSDLLGLLSTFGRDIVPTEEVRAEAEEREVSSVEDVGRISALVPGMVNLYIDNAALGGYLDRVRDCNHFCRPSCDVCYELTEDVVRIDKERRELVTRILEKVDKFVYSRG